MAFAAFSALIVTANAQTDVSSFLKDLSIGGYLDMYYQYDFGKPNTGNTVGWRQYDISHNQFSFAALGVNISKKTGEDSPFGFTLNVLLGKNADILNGLEPAGPNNSFKNLTQAYVTYAPHGTDLTVDFGKFLTWIGYEGLQSADNDNYSRSFLYTLAQPVYHLGIRATKPLPGGMSLTAAVVNGWNEVEESTATKSYGASLSKTFGKTFVAANYYGGHEQAGFGGPAYETEVNLGDLVITHQLTEKLKLAINADYGDVKPTTAAQGTTSGKFYGIAGYLKATISPVLAGAVRYETFTDKAGLRTGFATGARFSSITGNLDYSLSKDGLLRIEVRYDKANQNAFASESGAKDNLTTISFSHVLKF